MASVGFCGLKHKVDMEVLRHDVAILMMHDATLSNEHAYILAAQEIIDGYRSDEQDLLTYAAEQYSAKVGKNKSDIKFSFTGEKANTANHSLLAQAQERIAKDDNPEQVRQETGWHKGVDNQWKFEIDDSESGWGDGFYDYVKNGNRLHRLSDFLDHPELFKAYPFLTEQPPTKVGGFAQLAKD